MAAPERLEKKAPEVTLSEKVIVFIQKNRKPIFAVFSLIVLALVASVIGFTVRDRQRLNSFTALAALEQRYEAVADFIVPVGIVESDGEAIVRIIEIESLLADLEAFAANKSNSPYAVQRSYTIAAQIYEAQERLLQEERAWFLAATSAPLTYRAPVTLFNAAVSEEAQGNYDAAIALYERLVAEYENVFYIAARAQFSAGRLWETQGESQAALDAYRNILLKWPNDLLWANLAQSKVLLLSN